MKKSDFIPPVLTQVLSRFKPYGWSGDYSAWSEAIKQSKGYDNTAILEKVQEATLKVRNGDAAYERDSVLFDKVEYSWPLLASLLWIGLQKNGQLNVLDFGGSLGSTYFQNRKFYSALKSIHWNIVEQEKFVQHGKLFFESNELKFYSSPEDCFNEQSPSTVLFSCVLQYLEDPYETIKKIIDLNPEFIIVDNTPFAEDGEDRITIQRVDPLIYEASYPCWFMSRDKFISYFKREYEMIEGFTSELFIQLDGVRIPYEGFIFKRRS